MQALGRADFFDRAYEGNLSNHLFQRIETLECVLYGLHENGPSHGVEYSGDPLLGRQQDRAVCRHTHRPIIMVELRSCGP